LNFLKLYARLAQLAARKALFYLAGCGCWFDPHIGRYAFFFPKTAFDCFCFPATFLPLPRLRVTRRGRNSQNPPPAGVRLPRFAGRDILGALMSAARSLCNICAACAPTSESAGLLALVPTDVLGECAPRLRPGKIRVHFVRRP